MNRIETGSESELANAKTDLRFCIARAFIKKTDFQKLGTAEARERYVRAAADYEIAVARVWALSH